MGVLWSRGWRALGLAISAVGLVAVALGSAAYGSKPVYSRWALHQIPDFWKSVALVRMRRALRPGGVLRLSDIVYSFDRAEAEDWIEAWCASLSAAAGTENEGEWVRNDIEEHVRDGHSTYTWLLEPMIERCGFHIESAVRSPDGFFADYIAQAT